MSSHYDTAKEMAMGNDFHFHIAALLWRNGKLVSIGICSARQSKQAQRHYDVSLPSQDLTHKRTCMDACLHAEMDAIRRGCKPGDRIEVIRWTKDGQRAMAKPCQNCQAKIRAKALICRYTDLNGEWCTL
jgi:deoxycytidylate deaminase